MLSRHCKMYTISFLSVIIIFFLLHHVLIDLTQKGSCLQNLSKQIDKITKIDITEQYLNKQSTANFNNTKLNGHSTHLHDVKYDVDRKHGYNTFIYVVSTYISRRTKTFDLKAHQKTVARWHHTNSTAVVLGGNYDNGKPSGDCLGFLVLPLCTNIGEMDILTKSSWNLFKNKKPDVLFTEHVLEHLTPAEVLFVAIMSFRELNRGGVFRVAVPDGYKPSDEFQQYVRPPKSTHKIAWNVETLPSLFEMVGYNIRLREYYDVNGKFHSIKPVYDDDWKYGTVKRSAKHDPRQKITKQWGWSAPHSLWFDAIKPLDL